MSKIHIPHPHLPHHYQQETNKSIQYLHSLDLIRRLSLIQSQSIFSIDSNGKLNTSAGSGGVGGMEFKELIRKFNKHVKGRELTALTATTEHTLFQLLSSASKTSNFNSKSYYSSPSAATLFQPSITSPSDLSIAKNAILELENALTSITALNKLEVESAKVIIGFGKFWTGDFEGALRTLSELNEDAVEVQEGERYWYTLRVLGRALIGHCQTKLSYPIEEVINSYKKADEFYLDSVASLNSSSTTSGTAIGVKNEAFLNLIGEALLFRLSLLTCNTSNPNSISYHSRYLSLTSASTSLSTYKSLLIYNSYRSLLLSTFSPSTTSVETIPKLSDLNQQITLLNKMQETLIRRLTKFPKAGEVNLIYLEFLDGVFKVWKEVQGGGKEGVEEIIEIMYNSLTHTFQSQRLLRYLIQLLISKGTTKSLITASKSLKLYVQLWENCKLTDAKGVIKSIRKFNENSNNKVGEKSTLPEGAEEKESITSKLQTLNLQSLPTSTPISEDFDIDSTYQFIQTNLIGCKLLSKLLNPVQPQLAHKLIERCWELFKEEGIEDKILEGEIEGVRGVCWGVLASIESDSTTRSTKITNSILHLQRSTTLNPTSFIAHYQLAYQFIISSKIELALIEIRKCLELNETFLEGWHLLGLILGSKKDLVGGLQVLETALDLVDGDEEEDAIESNTEEVEEKKSKSQFQPNDGLNYNSIDKLEIELEIRMSKNIFIESLEGSNAALIDQSSLFAFFSIGVENLLEIDLADDNQGSSKIQPNNSNSRLEVPTNNGKSTTSLSKKLSIRQGLSSSGVVAGSTRSRNVSSSGLSTVTFPSPSESLISLSNNNNTSTSNVAVGSKGIKIESNPRTRKLLIKLWLMSAASFRRLGKLEECRGAIQEAESLNADDSDIWVQFALYCIANSDLEQARTSIQKALSISIDLPSALIISAKLHLLSAQSNPLKSSSQIAFAELILFSLTSSAQGWNIPEAWFELSKCYKLSGRLDKERECLGKALELENCRSVRGFEVVSRIL